MPPVRSDDPPQAPTAPRRTQRYKILGFNTPAEREAYRRDSLAIPTELDRWLARVAKAQDRPAVDDIKDFPTFGINDFIEATIRVVETQESGVATVAAAKWSLELCLLVLPESGAMFPIGPSPWIILGMYKGYKTSLDAPEWVVKSDEYDGSAFYQPRARMLEMIRTQLDSELVPHNPSRNDILRWSFMASSVHNARVRTIVDKCDEYS
ncbi:hypothetical protein DFP72DRAFT_1069348 [Ephemerocybe angulata]|uniref:Uncharacterized protein n=1 Tax=Ephemerocybe angulata TaxID=980116 RepID=A0A8H6HW26_9AGAR|nr:hypothetical protein DFP72DRAFT_1069348 [Tulosesus angulatus]